MKEMSIIILNYNTFQLTCQCIESIYKFSKLLSFEIILVDNGSSECDPEKFKEIFPEIILVVSKKNLGFSKGNNLGIKYSSAKYILLLNSDTFFVDDSLVYAKNVMDMNLNVHVLTGKLTYPDGQIQPQCGKFPSISLQLTELLRFQKLLNRRRRGLFLLGAFFDHQSIVFPETIWGTFFLFRRKVLDIFEDGKLPDKYFMYMEDIDWCYKIKQAGLVIMYDPKIHIVHYFSGSSSSKEKSELLRKNFIDLIKSNKGISYYYSFQVFYKLNLAIEKCKLMFRSF